jgi:3-oxoadipate enol-lactonase
MELQMAFYETHGRTNYFLTFGQGRPVLLLHGISNSGRAWGRRSRPWSRQDIASLSRTMPAMVHPGAFRPPLASPTSPTIPNGSWRRWVSTGWMWWACRLADGRARTRPAPSRSHRAARCRQQLLPDDLARIPGDGRRLGEYLRKPPWPGDAVRTELARAGFTGFPEQPEGIRTYQAWHGIAATCDGASLAKVARAITDFDVLDRIRGLATPTLDSRKRRSHVPATVQPDHGRNHGNGTYVEISGAAHISNVDSSDAFNAHMLAFLRDDRAIPPDKPRPLRQGGRFRRKIAGRPR